MFKSPQDLAKLIESGFKRRGIQGSFSDALDIAEHILMQENVVKGNSNE